ncbi:hypothetical protein, partial [Leptospira wolffii]|uniref:hypothetical protein n=1 Tax=Leptospira wolffii TaxID=409998 RepID=UPI001E5A0B52
SQLIKNFNFSFAVIDVVKELNFASAEPGWREESSVAPSQFGFAGDFPYGKGRKNQCMESIRPVKEKPT